MGDIRALMLDPEFDRLPLADQTDVMRQAGAPDEMLSEWVRRNAKGPMISGPGAPTEGFSRRARGSTKLVGDSVGFEDTGGDVKRILDQYHEPNRARDVLPNLAQFALLFGGIPSLGGSLGRLGGLSLPAKAGMAGKAVAKAGAYGAAGYGANEGLKAAGVPAGVSEALVGAAGLGTKPGRAMVRAGVEALAGGRAAAPAVEAALTSSGAARALPPQGALAEIGQAAAAAARANGATSEEARTAATRAVLEASRSGKAAAPPSKLEGVLRKNLDDLQGPRIHVGAQRVGRDVGMTQEQVRMQAGPVLGEALGEASPILPKQALQSVINTMRAIPIAQREAYVARATSGKAQWQIENIRRTLEHLGLLVPAGVAAGGLAQAE